MKSPRFAIFDLAEGKSYNFRVRCCNSAGVGEPSVPTGDTIVGDKLGELTKLAAASLQTLHTENSAALFNRIISVVYASPVSDPSASSL